MALCTKIVSRYGLCSISAVFAFVKRSRMQSALASLQASFQIKGVTRLKLNAVFFIFLCCAVVFRSCRVR